MSLSLDGANNDAFEFAMFSAAEKSSKVEDVSKRGGETPLVTEAFKMLTK